MRKTAVILVISLALQLITPISVRAEEVYEDEDVTKTVSVDTQNATEIEGFFQEKYYRRENGYSLFIGAAMPEWDTTTTELTDVAYQLDNGELTVLGTVLSDKFDYYKPTWSDRYGGCLTLSLDDKPADASEGSHSLTVYFTVGETDYKVSGTTELVDELSKSEGTAWKWSSWLYDGNTEYISSQIGSSIEMLYAISYSFQEDEKWTELQLVPSGTNDAVLTASPSGVSGSSSCLYDYNRYSLYHTGKDGLSYNLTSSVIPEEYHIYGHFDDIVLTKNIPDGYYDMLVFTSTGRKYREENAYYATSKPIIYSVNRKYYSEWYKGNDDPVFFSDDTGDYISVFVYGLNLDRYNIPTFYDTTGNTVLARYIDDDPECGYEQGNKWGNFFRLKKSSADLGVDEAVQSYAKVDGDVVYASEKGYCETSIESEGVFFEEYLDKGKLYDGSPGRLRLYIGEGINCDVGDTVTYEMGVLQSIDYMPTYTETAKVQSNGNGKYIEFGENSNIYQYMMKRWSFKLIKNNVTLTSSTAGRYMWVNKDIQYMNILQVPSGCSWEVHAIGEITKTIYSGTNTSSSTASVLNGSQLFYLAQQGTVRVCIYNAGGTVRERNLVCFQYSSQANFPIAVDTLTDPQIKVVDSKGNPISDADVVYRGLTIQTSEKGIVTLTNYVPGNSLSISKQGYITITVDSFVRDTSGCSTYVLHNTGGTIEYAQMTLNGTVTDIITKEATINTYYKTTDFSIKCKANGTYDTYELYSGDKLIARNSDGNFTNLRFDSFTVGEPVYLSISGRLSQTAKIKLGIQVINLDPRVYELSIGDKMSVKAPDSIPIVGGKELTIDLGTLPIQTKISADNKMQIGINAGELFKKDKDWFSTLKKMNKNNFSQYLSEAYNGKDDGNQGVKVDEINSKFKVIGYLEGPLTNSNNLKGKLLVEFSMSYSKENQYFPLGIPVVIETSISGKVNADGSISFTSEEGLTGGKLSVGGEIGAGLYGGVGVANAASAGVYGNAAIGIKYDIFPEIVRGLNEFYVKGDAGFKLKLLGKDVVKWAIVDGTYYIINNDTSVMYMPANQAGIMSFSIDNDKVYNNLSRNYLGTDGDMVHWNTDSQTYADGSINETILQNATSLDIIPQVIRVGDTAMLFYLADAGAERADADRSMLVYSVWDEAKENWSEPTAVLDDGTADFAPDLYTDGTKVYAVWQNAKESLAGELTLNDIAERLVLHAAVYDEEQDKFVDLGTIESENGLFQQQPQIVADGDTVSVYWYENEQDNVLGLSGTNRIYQAVLADADAASVRSVLSVPTEEDTEEDDTEGSEDTDTDEEDSNLEKADEDGPDEEDSDTEDPDAEEEEEVGKSDGEDSENPGEGNEIPGIGDSDMEEPDTAVSDNPEWTESDTEQPDEAGENRIEAIQVGKFTYGNTYSKYVATEEGNEAVTEEDEAAPDDSVATPDNGEEAPNDNGVNPEEDEEGFDDERADSADDTVSSTEDSEESEETQQVLTYDALSGESAWRVSFVKDEKECIISADAGKADGKNAYAYTAGALNNRYEVTNSKIVLITEGESAATLETGILEKTEFASVYAEETLTWYSDGDIHYLNENGGIASLFGEGTLPSSSYTLLSDNGSPEVIFPVNADGKSNLYRIGYENGEFLTALPITEQENYIQYVDGFVNGGKTVLVYNSMEVDDDLEEVQNSLCMGTLDHSYYDIALQSAGSMVRQDEETGEDILEITAQIYNNGTVEAEQLTLSLAKADGTVLETVAIDTVLASGETEYITAAFSLDNITEEGEYTVAVSGMAETNTNNNSTVITLGEASLQVTAEVIAVGDTRTMQVGIENTGVTACGGTVSVQDAETGEIYCSSDFEPISRGQISFAEIEIDKSIFSQQDVLVLEAVVVPEGEGQTAISDYVTVYAPTYTVDFVTQTGEEADEGTHTETIFVGYGRRAAFPTNPTKEGAYFIGWYTAEDPAAGTLYTEETPVTEDMTLYACFATEQGSISMEKCSVSEIPTQLYTGKALKPAVTVKWGSEVLSSKTDYTVNYQNNKEQGKATVTITGKGRYSGSITRTFMILYPLNKVTVKALPAVDFTGEYYTPDVTVTYNNQTLKKGKDYTVTYTNNRNAGTAGVTLTGIGAYSGIKTVTFTIRGLSITKGIVFEKPEDVVYSGGKQTPIITVKTADGTQLQAGSDYKVVYENAVNKGTATATVIGNGSFTGTKKFTYKILAKPLTAEMVAGIAQQTYTGSAVKPAVTVTDESTSSEPLIEGKDYTVSYNKNKATGTATVTVKGKGNYSGTVKTSFEIVKVDLEELKDSGELTVKVNDMAYTGRALKPSVQVYEGTKKLPNSAYTVAYSNNVGTGSGNDTGTVTVTGRGDYTGTVTADFRIVDKAKLITSLRIDKIADQTYTGSVIEPEVTVMDGTYKLIKGQDYETIYSNQYNAGKATVTVKGIGSYAGSRDVTYKIAKRPIADRNVLNTGFTIEPVADMKYTGYALKPDVVIKDKGEVLTLGKDYKLSYKNNTKISTGKATVIVTGMGNYSGSISTTTFDIVSWDYDSLWARISDQVYTGKALKPQVTFYIGDEEIALKSGTAVKITYADNKNTGTATATITGKGELRNINPIKVTFTIEQASLEDAVVGKVKNQTLKGVAVKPVPKVKVGKNTLKAGRDFTVKYLRNGVKGEAEMIITGTGNYTGECRKTFIVQ